LLIRLDRSVGLLRKHIGNAGIVCIMDSVMALGLTSKTSRRM